MQSKISPLNEPIMLKKDGSTSYGKVTVSLVSSSKLPATMSSTTIEFSFKESSFFCIEFPTRQAWMKTNFGVDNS
ncbi:hypothetical protein HanIR_Chr02g0057831 [Helianthus annuus]|nr:hypothetical protein HanIR_Chr02g0057831 [Helianthus annuus]